MRDKIGHRLFLSFITALIVSLSSPLPDTWGRQLEYDFKLPGTVATEKKGDTLQAIGVDSERAVINASTDSTADTDSTDSTADTANTADSTDSTDSTADTDSTDSTDSTADTDSTDSTANTAGINGGAGYVVLDAGHGGRDPGTITNGVCEMDIDLRVSLRTAGLLRDAGVDCVLTRDSDTTVTLGQRAELVNSGCAAFLVSVHCDWYEQGGISGTSTLYDADDGASKELAYIIQKAMADGLGTADRGIHPHKNIFLLRESQVPAVCVELGFMSNEGDLALLKTDEFAEKAAENLAGGILAAIGNFAPSASR